MTEENPTYTDPEEFQKQFALGGGTGGGFNKDMLSFRFACMTHIFRMLHLGSKEWRGDYWKTSKIILPDGRIIENTSWEESSRQVYCNAVRMFYNLLEPKLWKINAKGEMEATAFNKEIIECAVTAKDLAKKVETTDEHNKELLNQYIEAHHDLFVWLNRYAEYHNYFSTQGIIQ